MALKNRYGNDGYAETNIHEYQDEDGYSKPLGGKDAEVEEQDRQLGGGYGDGIQDLHCKDALEESLA